MYCQQKALFLGSIMTDFSKDIAQKLLEVGAVKLNLHEPYTWASGWKSPIYCDNRKTLSYPSVRELIKTELSSEIFMTYPSADAIAGVATAGIPQASLVADLLKLPLIYVRSSAKGHGLTNLIEGDIVQTSRVIVIEDLISTGGSSIRAAQALQEAGLEVLAVFATFTYDLPEAEKNFSESGITLHSLTDYDTLIEIAQKQEIITPDQMESLRQWRQSPATWNG